MVRRLTHKEFMERFMEKNSNANNIEVLGTYVNNRTKIKCKCKIDGNIWEARPSDLLSSNSGCPKCGNKRQSEKLAKTHEEFIKELEEVNPNIEILGTYVNNRTKIKCKCKIDGYIWEVTPNHLLKGHGCPKCKTTQQSIKQTKTHKDFIKELEEINSNIKVLGTYISSQTKIKCKCKIDGHIWEATPNNLLSNSGCPKCNSSKGEKRIVKYLDSIDLDYIPQHTFEDCKYKNVLPFDFYIPSLDIAIEYDGELHYEIVKHFGGIDRFIDIKIRDTIKTWYCKKNDIKLIRIPYWNFDNIEEILEKELTLNK